METFAKLFERFLVLYITCFDRIVIQGYLPLLTRPEHIVHFFRDVHGQYPITPQILVKRTLEYRGWVEGYARNHKIPMLKAEKGVSKEDCVQPHLQRMERRNQPGVYKPDEGFRPQKGAGEPGVLAPEIRRHYGSLRRFRSAISERARRLLPVSTDGSASHGWQNQNRRYQAQRPPDVATGGGAAARRHTTERMAVPQHPPSQPHHLRPIGQVLDLLAA